MDAVEVQPKRGIYLNRVISGDSVAAMRRLADVGLMVSSVVTDPPYDLGMDGGRGWDTFDGYESPSGRTGFVGFSYDWASAALELLPPGGFLASFCSAQRYHRLAAGVEDAGFEVVDQLDWLYGTGFPKAQGLDKLVDTYLGTADNRLEVATQVVRGVRVEGGHVGGERREVAVTGPGSEEAERWLGWSTRLRPCHEPILLAQKPVVGTVAENVLRNEERYGTGLGVGALNIAAGGPELPDGSRAWAGNVAADEGAVAWVDDLYGADCSRVFYCPKPSLDERSAGGVNPAHPTVKPVGVMDWLCKLTTPPGGIVLDPFCGSGTTLVAARLGGFRWLGIELSDDYAAAAERRARRARMTAR